MRELVTELALGLQEHVLPYLGAHAGRAHVRAGAGGDVTFAIDTEAEDSSSASWPSARPRSPSTRRIAAWSRPAGRNAHARAGRGSDRRHAARARGFESPASPSRRRRSATASRRWATWSSAAWSRSRAAPLRGRARRRGRDPRPTAPSAACLSDTRSSRECSGRSDFAAARRVPLDRAGELIDASSVGGAVFDLGSATYDLTRLVTGQLDAYVDVGTRMIEEAPALRARFEEVGGGAVLNNSPYDLAAAVLCVQEAGAIVTRRPRPSARRAPAARLGRTTTRCRALRPPTRTCTPRSWRRSSEAFERLRRRRWIISAAFGCRWAGRGHNASSKTRATERAHLLATTGQRWPQGPRRLQAPHRALVGRRDTCARGAPPGKRVLHVSATAMGGGVSEILYALVPLMRDAGLEAEWHIVIGREEFFNVTKLLHNALQGNPHGLSESDWEIFDRYNAAEREGARGRLRLRDRPRPAAGRPAQLPERPPRQVDLALPHRPLDAQHGRRSRAWCR